MDRIISAVIHLSNKNYAALVDDFIDLGILPRDCDRSLVIPLMDKALSPYVKGGGAQRYAEEIKKTYGFEGDGASSGEPCDLRSNLVRFRHFWMCATCLKLPIGVYWYSRVCVCLVPLSNAGSPVGGFSAMTSDVLTVLNDIPFSIPPYFALIGRAVVTLEGIALTGNPNYGIITEVRS